MDYINGSIKKYSKLYKILFLIISISLTIGLIISIQLDKNLQNNIYNYFSNYITNIKSNNISFILYPIICYSIIFLSSLTIIGSFLAILSLILENISIGLLIGIILKKQALKGLLFSIIYFSLTKLLFIIILIYLIISIYKFITRFLLSIKNKLNESIYNLYSKIILKFLLCIFIIFIYNILLIFILPKIINVLSFLINI